MTIHSMTGYAQARAEGAEGAKAAETDAVAVVVTLKGVNHRFLDLRWQLPAELEAMGAEMEKQVRAAVRRGHVDARVWIERAGGNSARLDSGALKAYVELYGEVRRRLEEAGCAPGTGPDAAEVLRVPGIMAAPGGGGEAAQLQPVVRAALARALEQFNRMRAGEGALLATDLRQRLDAIAAARARIGAHRPAIEAAVLERLRGRMRELTAGVAIAPERLLQEAALQAERSDISEELTRLDAHLEQFRALLKAGGEVGKKLDFLTQELNREVNTLLSKTTSASPAGLEVATLGLELKAEVEKIREQIQNLE